jgi:hypothetical protein
MYANGCCEPSISVHSTCCSRMFSRCVSCGKSGPVGVLAALEGGCESRCRRRNGTRTIQYFERERSGGLEVEESEDCGGFVAM